MDALSDVLRAVRLTGAVFFDVHASDPWVAETPPGDAIVGRIFPGADHLISYHVVTRGSCWGGVLDESPLRLGVPPRQWRKTRNGVSRERTGAASPFINSAG